MNLTTRLPRALAMAGAMLSASRRRHAWRSSGGHKGRDRRPIVGRRDHLRRRVLCTGTIIAAQIRDSPRATGRDHGASWRRTAAGRSRSSTCASDNRHDRSAAMRSCAVRSETVEPSYLATSGYDVRCSSSRANSSQGATKVSARPETGVGPRARTETIVGWAPTRRQHDAPPPGRPTLPITTERYAAAPTATSTPTTMIEPFPQGGVDT